MAKAIAAAAPAFTADQLALIAEREEILRWLEPAKVREMDIRKQLADALIPSPKEGTQLYNIQLADVTATSYNITATPQSGMTSDKCGKLGLSSVGARSAEKGSVANCWK